MSGRSTEICVDQAFVSGGKNVGSLRWVALFALFALVSLACTDQAVVDQLGQEKASLEAQIKELEQKLAGSEAIRTIISDRMEFLARSIQGVTATLVTTEGDIEVEFYPDKAPIHCFNFITRAEGGFYDGTVFHRVIKNFMIQGGDPLSRDNNPANDGTGGPVIHIPHEFNDLKHTPGILSMARTTDISMGAGSQFFIMHGVTPALDGQYTVFGKVTNGMDVVNKIAEGKTAPGDRPVKTVRIERIEVRR